jgi:hypothetical protein
MQALYYSHMCMMLHEVCFWLKLNKEFDIFESYHLFKELFLLVGLTFHVLSGSFQPAAFYCNFKHIKLFKKLVCYTVLYSSIDTFKVIVTLVDVSNYFYAYCDYDLH